MGSWLSGIFSDNNPSTSGLLGDKSQSTVFLMNRILEFILRNADLADMISLATDDGCKKWLIIAESRITELFDKVKIKLEAKDGVLYLKKIDVLEKEATKGGINKVYCKLLAFFFIRLFQVVGALALSVLDTQIPNSNYLESSTLEIPERRGVPFFPKEVEKKKKFWNIFSGGAVLDITHYKDSNNNLTTYNIGGRQERGAFRPGAPRGGITVDEQIDSIIFTQNRGEGTPTLEFNLTLVGNGIKLDNIKKGGNIISSIPFQTSAGVTIGNEGVIKVIYIQKELQFDDYIVEIFKNLNTIPNSEIITILKKYKYLDQVKDDYKIRDTNIFILKDQLDENVPSFIYTRTSKVSNDTKNSGKQIRIQFNLSFNVNKNKGILEITNIKLKGLNDLYIDTRLDGTTITFNRLLGTDTFTTTDTTDKDPKSNNQTIPQFLEKKMEILYKRVEESLKYGITKGKDGFVRPLLDVKIKEHPLKYSELWGTLSNPPVKAFCTGRALQLLNASGLTRQIPQEIEPLIYETKFPLIKNKSLPEKGKPIIESAPFKALDSLYSAPPTNILEVNKSYVDGQIITLDKLLKSFNTSGIPLREIKEEDGTPVGKIKDPATIKYLRTQASLLLNIQQEHTKKVETLLKKIFIIDNNITLNPNILAKGIKGIEEIAVEARDLLTDYFSNCQTEYTKGVKVITDPSVLHPQQKQQLNGKKLNIKAPVI